MRKDRQADQVFLVYLEDDHIPLFADCGPDRSTLRILELLNFGWTVFGSILHKSPDVSYVDDVTRANVDFRVWRYGWSGEYGPDCVGRWCRNLESGVSMISKKRTSIRPMGRTCRTHSRDNCGCRGYRGRNRDSRTDSRTVDATPGCFAVSQLIDPSRVGVPSAGCGTAFTAGICHYDSSGNWVIKGERRGIDTQEAFMSLNDGAEPGGRRLRPLKADSSGL